VNTPTRWLALLLVGGVLAAVSTSVGCARGVTQTGDTALITVETSQLFITVKNQSGQPLSNVHVSIVPVGAATVFTATISRMESGEKRDLSLAEFHGRDGTPFNLRVVRPKTVKVSGTNVDEKTVEVEVPWRS
jgi:Flp pilus assembly protein CpaB